MRRYGPSPNPAIRYRDRPGAYAVIFDGAGNALMAKQGDHILLPGGGIEPGESVLQALHREVYEETGWRVAPIVRLGAFSRHCWLTEERYHSRKIQHVYLCRAVRRLGPPLEPDHTPVWANAATAARILAVDGERVFMETARWLV